MGQMVRRFLVLVAAFVALLAFAGGASAKIVESDGSFKGEAGTPSEGMEPTYVAVDEKTGEVYVIDHSHDAIDVFDESGKYLAQIANETGGSKSFSFGGSDDVAIDNSGGAHDGRVYVESNGAGEVFAFEPEAGNKYKFLWESNAGVGYAGGVAVDTAGNPWLSDILNGVQKLDPETGTAVGSPLLKEHFFANIAFDSAGDIALVEFGGGADVYDMEEKLLHEDHTGFINEDVAIDTANNSVFTVDAAGVTIWDSGGKKVAETPFGPTGAKGAAVNVSSNKVYVTEPGKGQVDVYTLVQQYSLEVETTGTGTGAVTCNGTTCQESYDNVTPVKLEAAPGGASRFVGWTVNGNPKVCEGTGPCEITLSRNTKVQADFALEEHELKVGEAGAGEVTSIPAGIACGTTCNAKFPDGLVALTAVPAAHNHFVGWTGCDSVTGETCEVDLTADKSVSAEFAPTMDKLTVGKAGTGSGSVSCQVGVGPQESCKAEYEDGTVVMLTGAPVSGSTFAGFSGEGCSGTGSCVVTLSGSTEVTATFILVPVEKPVEKAGTPTEKAQPPVEKAEKPRAKKHLTRAQLLAIAIKKCRKLPKRKKAACIKKAKKKYAPPKHAKHNKRK